ncbi:MAG: 30S ribosomal protein S6 [Solirubrobacterales bacterium]|nr:30S ribosomal protein S6 [Solirubrobacterales bacterium]
MPEQAPIYDLMLLLSTSAPEERRTKILADVETAISAAGGSIERNDDWGVRRLSYAIAHQSDAEYHLLQFNGPSSLLETLNYTLRITDGVLRSRIIKVLPGTPPAPDSPPPVVAGASAATPGGAPVTDE